MLTETPPDCTGAPRGARLGEALALVAWHEAASANRFAPHLGRAALARPYAAVRLDAAAGLNAALLRLPRAGGARLLHLGQDARTAPALPLDGLAGEADAVVAALSPAARARLLGFMLEVGVGLFRAGREPAFLRACRTLADGLVATASPSPRARIVARLPAAGQVIEVPADAPPGTWHLLGAEAARRATSVTADGVTLVATSRACAGDLLHAPGIEAPFAIDVPAEGLPHALAWIETLPPARAESAARLLRAALGGRVDDPAAQALLRELALMRPRAARWHDGTQQPVAAALELALPDTGGGILLRGWLRDPHALVQGLALRTQAGDQPVPPSALHRFARPELAARFTRTPHGGEAPQGFVAHVPELAATDVQSELVLQLASGAEITLVAPLHTLPPAAARDAVLGSVPPASADAAMMEGCLAPAAARLHQAALAGDRTPSLVRFGTPVARPRVSVLIPLYRNLSFLRAQLAAFACDPAWAEVETIFVLDSPEQRAEVEHLLQGLSLMHGLPMTLAVMPRNLGYAAANNAGAALARAPHLLLLNSDVLPAASGWLAPMLAALEDRKVGAAGPKLLFEDGSLQHAGLLFAQDSDGIWFNRHYHKGFPRHFAPACRPRQVPGVTGAALLVRRGLFEAAGGVTEDYIIGDYEDSDLCLKLRRQGASIAYVPQAELWHFERRSIREHRGYTRTLASLYNRTLHHARWNDSITALMARFAEGAA